MTREEALERFCLLTSRVNREVFGFRVASDRFCPGQPDPDDGYRFDEDVLGFIEAATEDRIRSHAEVERLRDQLIVQVRASAAEHARAEAAESEVDRERAEVKRLRAVLSEVRRQRDAAQRALGSGS